MNKIFGRQTNCWVLDNRARPKAKVASLSVNVEALSSSCRTWCGSDRCINQHGFLRKGAKRVDGGTTVCKALTNLRSFLSSMVGAEL